MLWNLWGFDWGEKQPIAVLLELCYFLNFLNRAIVIQGSSSPKAR